MQLLPLRLDDGSEVLRSAKARSLGAEALRLDDSLRATFEALKRPRPECNLVGAVPTATIGFVLRRLNALHVSAVKTVVLASASHPQDLTILCRSSWQGGRISDALICDKLNAGHRVSNHINIHLRSRPSNHCVACLMRAASRTKCRSPGTLPELFTFFWFMAHFSVRRTAPFLATLDFQCKPRHSRHLGARVCTLKTFTQSRGAPDELARSRRDLIFPGFIGKFRDRVEIACAQGAFVRDERTS